MTSSVRWAAGAAALVLSSAFFVNCGGGGSDGKGGATGGAGGMGGDAATGGSNSTGGTGTGGTGTGGTGTGGTGTGEGGMGGATGEEPAPPKELVIVSHDTSISLLEIVDGELEVISTASLPADGLLLGHRIFNVIQQPGQQRLFVASSNDCSEGALWCWGNGRIDLFTFSQKEIRYEGVAYEMNHAAFLADGISCAEGTEEDIGYLGQEGSCQPNGLAFSPDGTRLYVDDDHDDVVEIFKVDPVTGELEFLAEGEEYGTRAHGLVAHPDGKYLYNGTNVFDVSGDTVTVVAENDGGNATRIVRGDVDLLVTSILDWGDLLGVYELDDLESPTEIATYAVAARDFDVSSDLSRFVSVGRDVVSLLSFDGEGFTPLGSHSTSGIHSRQNRGVALAGDSEQFAVVAYFRGGDGGSIQSGGAVLFHIDPEHEDGPLLEQHVLPLDGAAFVALRVIAEGE